MPQNPTKLPATLRLVDESGLPSQTARAWEQRVSKTVPIVGTGTPEGVVEAPQYQFYVDETTPTAPVLYIKTQPEIGGDRTKGWASI